MQRNILLVLKLYKSMQSYIHRHMIRFPDIEFKGADLYNTCIASQFSWNKTCLNQPWWNSLLPVLTIMLTSVVVSVSESPPSTSQEPYNNVNRIFSIRLRSLNAENLCTFSFHTSGLTYFAFENWDKQMIYFSITAYLKYPQRNPKCHSFHNDIFWVNI